MAIRNRDSSGRWHGIYFRAYVTEIIPAGVVVYSEDAIHFKSDFPSRDRIETELASELSELWADISHQNSGILLTSETVTLVQDDGVIKLDPPAPGKLSQAFLDVDRIEDTTVSFGDRRIPHVGKPAFYRYSGPRWMIEGRSLWLRMGADNVVGKDFDVEIFYTPQPLPPDLDSKFSWKVLPAEAHPVLAMGAALRIMKPSDSNYRSVRASYNSQRAKLIRGQSSHQTAGLDYRGSRHDFSIAD